MPDDAAIRSTLEPGRPQRAFREQAGSILPARFDYMEIPGIQLEGRTPMRRSEMDERKAAENAHHEGNHAMHREPPPVRSIIVSGKGSATNDSARATHVERCAHRIVLGALALSFLSGLALLAADLDTFLGSWVFWVKMGLIILLLGNGAWMTRIESVLRGGLTGDAPWKRLRVIAITSLTLWLTITFAGVVLTAV